MPLGRTIPSQEFLKVASYACSEEVPLYWTSPRQQRITNSSTESECVAWSSCHLKARWIKKLIEEIYHTNFRCSIHLIDNKGLDDMIKNFGSNSKLKQINIKTKSLCNDFKLGLIELSYPLIQELRGRESIDGPPSDRSRNQPHPTHSSQHNFNKPITTNHLSKSSSQIKSTLSRRFNTIETNAQTEDTAEACFQLPFSLFTQRIKAVISLR